jgi:hypothetical protein
MERLISYKNETSREMICRYEDCDVCEEYCVHMQEDNCYCLQEVLEKLGRYEDLEEKGLLPKFHLGDEFWTVRLRKVLKSKIVMLQQKKDGTWRYRFRQEISPKYHDTSDYEESDYGKYFFVNKEEAEKLAEEQKKQWEEQLKRLEEKREKKEN